MVNLSEILNSEPDYSHLNITEKNITVNLSKEDQEAILNAFDRGFDDLKKDSKHQINIVLAKLKDQIWN